MARVVKVQILNRRPAREGRTRIETFWNADDGDARERRPAREGRTRIETNSSSSSSAKRFDVRLARAGRGLKPPKVARKLIDVATSGSRGPDED